MNTFLCDGFAPNAAHRQGPIIEWVDTVTRSLKYRQTLRVRGDFWFALPYSTNGPLGGFLIEETQPRHLIGGFVEWDQIFAVVPAPRDVAEGVTFPYQKIINSDLVEFPLSTGARMHYEYTYDPEGRVQPLRAYRLTKVGNQFYYTGVPPADLSNIIAADSKVRVWAGFITERSTPYVSLNDINQTS